MIDENKKYFSLFVDDKSFSDYLIKSLTSGDYSPLSFVGEPSNIIQLENLFRSLDNNHQRNVFTGGVLTALRQWKYGLHRLDVLEKLAILAARFRLSSSIPVLRQDILLLPNSLSEQELKTISILIGALGGFVAPAVYAFLEELFYGSRFDDRFIAQIFLGMCINKPRMYHKHIPKMFETIRKYPNIFLLDHIIDDFVQYVGIFNIVIGLNKLDEKYLYELIGYLGYHSWSPIRFVAWSSSNILGLKDELYMLDKYQLSVGKNTSLLLSEHLNKKKHWEVFKIVDQHESNQMKKVEILTWIQRELEGNGEDYLDSRLPYQYSETDGAPAA
jgi:hypothetical protein